MKREGRGSGSDLAKEQKTSHDISHCVHVCRVCLGGIVDGRHEALAVGSAGRQQEGDSRLHKRVKGPFAQGRRCRHVCADLRIGRLVRREVERGHVKSTRVEGCLWTLE